MADVPNRFDDPFWTGLASSMEQKEKLPRGALVTLLKTEQSNADQVSEKGAETPFQITKATRDLVLKRDGIDAYLSPQNAAEVAAKVLKDGFNFASKKTDDPDAAFRLAAGFYHAGGDQANWGARTKAYIAKANAQIQAERDAAFNNDFSKWLAAHPATPTTAPTATPQQDPGSVAFGQWLKGGDQIPGTPVPFDRAPASQIPQAPAPAEPGLMDQAIGAGEAGLTAVTGATTGTIGGNLGLIGGLAGSILNGSFGTPQAAQLIDQTIAQGMQAGTYAPRTAVGQERAGQLGDAMQQLLPIAPVLPGLAIPGAVKPVGPAGVIARAGIEGTARDVAGAAARPAEAMGMVAPGAVGDAAAGAAGAAVDAGAAAAAKVAGLAKGVTTLPRRALEALRGEGDSPTPGTMGSVGAAGADAASQRLAAGASLPVPVDGLLTKGMLSRDPAQLKFEVETAKNPEMGAPLRDNRVAINDTLLRNFDTLVDQTGSEHAGKPLFLRAVGAAVDDAFTKFFKRAVTEVKARYEAARAAGEMEAPVSLQAVIDHLNQSAPEATTAPLLKTARDLAVKLGIAQERDGRLIPADPAPVPYSTLTNTRQQPGVTLNLAEQFRQAINRNTDFEPTNIRQATILKGLIDQATDGKGGALYKAARAARTRMAQAFEDRAVIAKVLNEKQGTADRQVALEDIHKHIILDGSLDDVRTAHAVLRRGGSDGVQAWKELQGATLRHIVDEATKSATTDALDHRVLSPAALDRVIQSLDKTGKLDFIFGKQGAQRLRDINELARIAKTVPPEAAVNFSNTAATLLTGGLDVAIAGMSGVPAPVATLGRLGFKYIKDNALRKRINDALRIQEQQAPGRRRFKTSTPLEFPGAEPDPGTVH